MQNDTELVYFWDSGFILLGLYVRFETEGATDRSR